MKLKTALLGVCYSLALIIPVTSSPASAERGQDGEVKLIYAQAISTLNPYLSAGAKDVEAASLTLEPLAGYNSDGQLITRLAAELPSVENGGIAPDFTAITWRLQPGLKWSDGSDFTADDVVFTAQYCLHPEGGCAQAARYDGVASVEKLDDLSVKITFDAPKYYPYTAFVGSQSPILQKAQFAACLGAAAASCTEANFAPHGTGPFRVTDFKVNDTVLFDANPHYRDPAKPAFAQLTIKGGGDGVSAARTVMETGEFDYAPNVQINPDLQAQMMAAGKGQFVSAFGTFVERIEVNLTDPSPNLPEGQRSTAAHPHPVLSDLRLRQALSMAIDREALVAIGYGEAGRATCNLVPAPAIYASDNTACLTQDLEGAKALLEAAGWVLGPDGKRSKDGVKLELLFQTSVNGVRQDFQALIKNWWEALGITVELKAIEGAVYFGGDPASPDTFQKFYADVQMYANSFDGSEPEPYLAQYACDKAPRPETQWQGQNYNRYCDPAYDALVAELKRTSDQSRRAEIIIKLNDMLTKDSYTIIPLVDRGRLSAHANSLANVQLNAWDSELWNVQDWQRK